MYLFYRMKREKPEKGRKRPEPAREDLCDFGYGPVEWRSGGRPRKRPRVLDELEVSWIQHFYSHGIDRKSIGTCMHVEDRDVRRVSGNIKQRQFCNHAHMDCFERKFLNMFDNEVRLKFYDFLTKLKRDSIACTGCRISVLFSPTNLDLDWCYHCVKSEVVEHVSKLVDNTIVGTWNGDWVLQLSYYPFASITLINPPDYANIDLPHHKVASIVLNI